MATEIGKGQVTISADTSELDKTLGGLDKSVGDATASVGTKVSGMGGFFDTLTGKVSAGAEGFEAMNTKVNASMLGAATAVGAFALDSIQHFQDTALEAGKFSDTTGLTVEAASRWIAVGDDIGIGAQTMQGAFTKFNLAVANGKPALDKYGIDIAHAKDGTVDASESFIEAATAVGEIEDPTKRAQAAQELFGRSYGEVSELMTMSAEDLRTALDNVSDAQVIDESELQMARDYRAALDNLGDKVGDFQIFIAQKLIPVLLDAAEKIEAVTGTVGKLDRAVDSVTGMGIVDWATTAMDAMYPLDNILGGLSRTFDSDASAGERLFGVGETLVSWIPGLGEGVSRLGDAIFKNVEGMIDWTNGTGEATVALNAMRDAGIPAVEIQRQMEAAGLDYAAATAEVETKLTKQTGAMMSAVRQYGEYRTGVIAADDAAKAEADSLADQAVALADSQRAAQLARDEQNRLADAAYRVEQKVRDQEAAWDSITGNLDTEQAFLDLTQQFDDLGAQWMTSTADVQSGAVSQEQAMRDVASEINATKQGVLDYIEQIGNVPVEKATTYLSLIDEGKYDEVERRLGVLSRNREMELSITAKGGTGKFTITGVNAFAKGTDYAPGGLAYVHQDELIELPRGSRVYTADETRSMITDVGDMPGGGFGAGPLIGELHMHSTGNTVDDVNRALVVAKLSR